MSKAIAEIIFGAVLDAEGPGMQSSAVALLDSSGLNAEDLTFPDDARLSTGWKIAQALARKRRPVSAKTVWSAGAASKHFSDSDEQYFARLQVSNELDREHFAQVVEDFRGVLRHRSLLTTLESYVEQLRAKRVDVPSAAAALESYLRDMQAYGAADGTGEDDVLEMADDWDRQEAGEVTNIVPTGIHLLDQQLGGGWRPTLNIIAAQPGVGKSAMLASIIEAQIDRGLTVGLFGIEDGTRWVVNRLIARDMKLRCLELGITGPGWAVGDIGVRKRVGRELEVFQELAAQHSFKLKRLITYKHETIDTDELCRRGAAWTYNRKCATVYVDNGSEVEHGSTKAQTPGQPQQSDQFRLQVANSYRRMRSTAITTNTPWVVLVHTARPEKNEAERPPRVTEIAESAYIERRARLVLGLWERDKEPDFLRCTILKNTLGNKRGPTMKLARHESAALIDQVVGETVNLEQERFAEYRAQREKKAADEAHEKAMKQRAAENAGTKKKASAAAPPAAQLEITE